MRDVDKDSLLRSLQSDHSQSRRRLWYVGKVFSSPSPSFGRREAYRKGASEGGGRPPGESTLPLGLAARQGDVAQVQNGQGVGLCVEDPVLNRQQLIAGEK